jgi:hypothetical protein
MISYAGVPISNPDGSIFGTICFIDSKENTHKTLSLRLLTLFKKMIESSLRSVLSKNTIEYQDRLIRDLSMLYPICSYCKKVKGKDGKWVSVEHYIGTISGSAPSHGLCPECMEREMGNLQEHPPGKK